MREIPVSAVTDAVAELCVSANIHLPEDVAEALRRALPRETSPIGADILRTLLENAACAREAGLPICQDTGYAVVFADIGQEVLFSGGDFEDAVNDGVRRGYTEGYLRASVVSDPLRRTNSGDNTPCALHIRLVRGDRLRLTVAPKGFGSENCNALRMFTPSTSREEITAFVAGVARAAGGNPCPPVILGVGLGGVSETCMLAARRALLRPVGPPHPDAFYAAWERDMLEAVNATGVGPQGLGGVTTALGVQIEALPTHIAGLPCAVCVSCHATRHREIVI